MKTIPPINQIAFSVVDLRLTERWFREGFGLLPAGGNRRMMRGRLASRVQGLPGVASTCWWLVARNPWVQLELFQFEQPVARLMPHDARPCDDGYRRIGLWVEDFDAVLARLETLGSPPLAEPRGRRGQRRACVRNPDGVYVEIMERDPLGEFESKSQRMSCPVAVRSVTLCVPDHDAAVAFFGGAMGLPAAGSVLHAPDREACWGLPGARLKSTVFRAGDVLLEVAQYLEPTGSPRPAGHRISDQGILNLAFGARSRAAHDTMFRRATAGGARPLSRPVHLPGAGVVYVTEPQGASVEFLWLKPGARDREWGFEPRPIEDRPDTDTHAVTRRVRVAAPITRAWQVLGDQEGMSRWIGFNPVTVEHVGYPAIGDRGTVRRMKGPLGTVHEQVVFTEAPTLCRYRVIEGSPFTCHQGEIRLERRGRDCEIAWTIRFRPRVAGSGWLLEALLGRMLQRMLENGLRPAIEQR